MSSKKIKPADRTDLEQFAYYALALLYENRETGDEDGTNTVAEKSAADVVELLYWQASELDLVPEAAK